MSRKATWGMWTVSIYCSQAKWITENSWVRTGGDEMTVATMADIMAAYEDYKATTEM